MCNPSGIVFGAVNLRPSEVKGKKVLEVGSLDVNGSLRPVIEAMSPAEYTGVDLTRGPGVDLVCDVRDLIKTFGPEVFDLVVATELLEHLRDWREAIHNLKEVCQKSGTILITTRSRGHRYHGYPFDFWRYEAADLRRIFADCEITKLEKDSREPGVFLKAKKPPSFREKDLSGLALYSIVADRRVISLLPEDFRSPYFLKVKLKAEIRKFVRRHASLRKLFEIGSSLAQP